MTFDTLSKLDAQDNNGLMQALVLQPEAVAAMLNDMVTFTSKEKAIILEQQNKSDSRNVLMLAATFNIDALKGLLNILSQCDFADQEWILGAMDKEGLNFLTSTAYQKEVVIDILNVMNTLVSKYKDAAPTLLSILSGNNSKGVNVLTHAIENEQPEVIELVMSIVSKADITSQVAYLKQVINLPEEYKKTYIEAQVELQLQLFAVKMKAYYGETVNAVAQNLFDSLTGSWELYKNNPSDVQLEEFFELAIEDAKPLFNEVDDNSGIINTLIRWFKNFVSIFVTVDWKEETYDKMKDLAHNFKLVKNVAGEDAEIVVPGGFNRGYGAGAGMAVEPAAATDKVASHPKIVVVHPVGLVVVKPAAYNASFFAATKDPLAKNPEASAPDFGDLDNVPPL